MLIGRMRRCVGRLALAGSLALVGLPGPAAATPFELRGLPPLIGEVTRLVERHFYDPAIVAEVWDDALAGARAELRGPASEARTDAALAAMLARLGVSHTGYFRPGELAYYELMDIFARDDWAGQLDTIFPAGEIAYTGIGLVPRAIGGRSFVAGVYDGGPAAQAGILVGDELLTADGAPFDPIASFEGKAGRKVTLGVRRGANAAPLQLAVEPERIRPNAFFLDALKASIQVIERDGRRFGYVRIWSYARRAYQRALIEALADGPLAAVDGLVLDLRGGWGGAQADYAELFVGGAPIMTYAGRDGRVDYANFRWRRPVVALVDGGTRSGKEVIAYALQRHGIPLVGSRTAGALLAGRGYLLSDGSLLELAVADVRVEGFRLEGQGVLPDVAVPFELPYAAGRDPQRAAALALLARQPRPQGPAR